MMVQEKAFKGVIEVNVIQIQGGWSENPVAVSIYCEIASVAILMKPLIHSFYLSIRVC